MNVSITKADKISFTKLFAQRNGASYAAVLNECFSTEQLMRVFNAKFGTSLHLDHETGRIVVSDPTADFNCEIDKFALFAWRDMFLQIQTGKRAA